MKTSVLLAASLSLAGQSAFFSPSAWAGAMSGNGALSFAALVGQQSPHLTRAEKSLLLKYLNGDAKAKFPKGKLVAVKADSVTCRISDVDITAHSCELNFGARTVSLKGRAAHELYATL